MSDRRGFWSTLPGVFTAIGGAITAAVGLVTLSTQLGWFDSNDDDTPSVNGTETTTQSTARDSGDGSDDGGGAGGNDDDAPIAFTVEPSTVTFKLLEREATVTVRNTGQSAFTPEEPDISGADDDQFSATDVSCEGKRLAPGRTCQVRVFAPKTAGTASATLVVPLGDDTEVEVPLQDSLL